MRKQRVLQLAAIAVAVAGLMFAAPGCSDDDDGGPVGPGNPSPADVTINIVGNLGSGSYSPSPDTVTVGQTVSWKNNDSMTHTATDDGNAWNTGNIAPGATSSPITMNAAGSFPYSCTIHPSMTGSLVVEP